MDLDQADPRPAYQQVADELRKAIADGTYEPGDQLPTLAELTEHYNIAVNTARDAIRQLTKEGLVVSRQGKGAYVLRQPEGEPALSVAEVGALLESISQTLDDLSHRMTVVEQKLNDQDNSSETPPRPHEH